jgi:Dolichyl-phosphate-mannose-protein mannosyltransferase
MVDTLKAWKSLLMLSLPRTLSGQLAVVGIGLATFVALSSLAWPLGDDTGVFVWIGRAILDGGVPYRDAWDIKAPLTYYLYAFALGVFGRNEMSIRILDLIAVLCCCWLLRRLVLRFNGGNRFVATFAVIFFALTYYGLGLFETAQPDGWGGILLLAVVVLLLDSPWRPSRTMVAVGGVIAVATLIKQSYMMYLLLPVFFPVSKPDSEASGLSPLVECLLGFVLTVSVSMLLLFQLSGGLGDFLDVLRFIYSSYLPTRTLTAEAAVLWLVLFHTGVLGLVIPLLLSPVGLWLIRRAGMSRQASLLATWLGLTMLSVVMQGRYFPYHWIPATVALAAIFGTGLPYATSRWVTPSRGYLGVSPWMLLICLSTIAPSGAYALSNTYSATSYVLGLEDREKYVKKLTETWPWNWHYWALATLSAYIEDHSSKNDRVLVWGWDALVNSLSERKSPTRFGYSYPLIVGGPLRAKYRKLFLKEISRLPPRYIIVDTQESWALLDRSGLELLNDFPEFRQLVYTRYTLVKSVDAFQLWTLIQ